MRRTGWLRDWPSTIVMPILLALLGAAVVAPFMTMLLHPEFGLSGGHPRPWPWALAVLGCVGFWLVRILEWRRASNVTAVVVLMLGAFLAIGVWLVLEPGYELRNVLRNPISLVNKNAYLIPPIAFGLGAWVQAVRAAIDTSNTAAEYVRERVGRAWAALVVAIVLGSLIGGTIGDDGVREALIALPIALIAGAGAVALSEFTFTRQLARQRGTTAPGWDRWTRVFGGTAVVLLLVTFIGLIVIGPGVLGSVMDALVGAYRLLGKAILYVMYGIVYVLYFIYRGIAWILDGLGLELSTPEMPKMEMQEQATPVPQPIQEVGEPEPLPYLTLIRWIALILALIAVAAMIYFISRYRSQKADGEAVDEERTSVFSGDLLRNQLKDLFRRGQAVEKPKSLDLNRDPDSVRDSMLYLQVLAQRFQRGRGPAETPADFTHRLSLEWPNLQAPLGTLRGLYEKVRYGETEQDRQMAVAAWREIWTDRRVVLDQQKRR